MSIISRLMARMYKLPPAETYDIAVDRKLEVPMPDEVVLRADHYYPRHRRDLPTFLVRTPYGRAGYGVVGRLMAERGFQVLIQSCRGCDDSGGEFNPFRGEREDGLATLAWIRAQDWFDGRLGMAGPSYLGYTQWAVARDAGPALRAISTQVTSSEFRSVMYPGGSLNLEIFLQWMQVTLGQKASPLAGLWGMVNAGRRLRAGTRHLPLREADEVAVRRPIGFWRDWLEHTEPGDEWWATEDYSAGVAEVEAPNHMISGWYDFMLPQLLRDFAALQQAGRRPYLTIGPWAHSSNGLHETGTRESLVWLRAHLLGETDALRTAPVRVYVMGADEWRDLAAWPPADARAQRWYLQPEAALATSAPVDGPSSCFRYDPSDPTPNLGGATNATLGRGTGAQDNRKLEARPDVLVFTSAPLEQDMEVMGPVATELFVRSSLEYMDCFVRLCDVHPDGKSMNVCDGLRRLTPGQPAADPDGCRRVRIELWPTACLFRRGHRLRVQVSGGAFPRFARNLGTGEPLATGTTIRAGEREVLHDPKHPSAIVLPVCEGKRP